MQKHLPLERKAITHKFSVGGTKAYVTVGLYHDGGVGEIHIVMPAPPIPGDLSKDHLEIMARAAVTERAFLDVFSTAVSTALQWGVPLSDLVAKFRFVRDAHEGPTGNPAIPIANGIIDYVFRWIEARFGGGWDGDREADQGG